MVFLRSDSAIGVIVLQNWLMKINKVRKRIYKEESWIATSGPSLEKLTEARIGHHSLCV